MESRRSNRWGGRTALKADFHGQSVASIPGQCTPRLNPRDFAHWRQQDRRIEIAQNKSYPIEN
jgi:hypothetical protein